MMEAKYIIIDKVKPVIFSPAISHSDEANGRKVTSAGFVNIWAEEGPGMGILQIQCSGESTSLGGIESKGYKDTQLIRAMFKDMEY